MAGLVEKIKNRFFGLGTPRATINRAAQKQIDAISPPKPKKQKSHVVIWPTYTKEK